MHVCARQGGEVYLAAFHLSFFSCPRYIVLSVIRDRFSCRFGFAAHALAVVWFVDSFLLRCCWSSSMSSFLFIRFFSTNVGLSAEGLREPGPFHAQQDPPDLRPKLKHMEEQQNYYKTLGVGWDAPPDVIRKNYKQLALFYHPDKQDAANEEASAQFSKISEAYAILSDPLRRLVYDLVLGIRDKTDKEVINDSVWEKQVDMCFSNLLSIV